MDVHALTIIANDLLGHKGGCFAIRVRNVMHHIFKNLRPVGALRYCRKFCADFILTASRDLMMMQFDGYPDPFQNQTYFAAQLLKGIHRRNRKITALNAGTMAGISLSNFFPDDHEASSESMRTKAPDISTPQRTESKIKNSGSGPKYAASPRPLSLRYCSARFARERGSRA